MPHQLTQIKISHRTDWK